MSEQSTQGLASRAGKYLTFRLAAEDYGLEILKVQEIIGNMNVTRVPLAPDYIRGVINLRGKVIPIVSLRRKFQLDEIVDTDKTCIIVIQTNDGGRRLTMGIIVDEVSEVMNIIADQIEPTPEFGVNVDSRFILGMGKIDQKIVTLLEIDQVLSSEEYGAAQHAVGQAA